MGNRFAMIPIDPQRAAECMQKLFTSNNFVDFFRLSSLSFPAGIRSRSKIPFTVFSLRLYIAELAGVDRRTQFRPAAAA